MQGSMLRDVSSQSRAFPGILLKQGGMSGEKDEEEGYQVWFQRLTNYRLWLIEVYELKNTARWESFIGVSS